MNMCSNTRISTTEMNKSHPPNLPPTATSPHSRYDRTAASAVSSARICRRPRRSGSSDPRPESSHLVRSQPVHIDHTYPKVRQLRYSRLVEKKVGNEDLFPGSLLLLSAVECKESEQRDSRDGYCGEFGDRIATRTVT